MYFDKPYYVVPADDLAEEAFVVLRDALSARSKVGVGQLAMRGQEYVVALKPCGSGHAARNAALRRRGQQGPVYFREIGDHKPDADLLDMAAMLIERKAGKFDPTEFHNRYVDALQRAHREKQKRRARRSSRTRRTRRAKGSNVIDLMAALKKSLGDEQAGPRQREGGSARRKPAARRTTKKAPAKKPARKRA